MLILEIRDSELAKRFLLEGLLLQCVQPPLPRALAAVLGWYLETAVEGIPLLPAGVVADVGHLVFGECVVSEAEKPTSATDSTGEQRVLPSTLKRQYEDWVLGKLYNDRSFDRGADGLKRYPDPRDRAKGLAFLLKQMGERANCAGVVFSPGVIRECQRQPPEEVFITARKSLAEHGPLMCSELNNEALNQEQPLLEFLYHDLIQQVRGIAEVLGTEDVFELEHGTALAGFGQRIALRHVLQATAELESRVPHQPARPENPKKQVATQIVDEDTYPIGGFSSISNRGSIESLLHSQLAFMEQDERPDMFDIKFLRDELLYYSRDENQFLRRRRRFVFGLANDLSAARIKDPDLPWQRIILLLALIQVAVSRLTDWLSEDALVFEFVFFKPQGKAAVKTPVLTDERELLEMIFREQIENQTVQITDLDSLLQFQTHCEEVARKSLCHAVWLSSKPKSLPLENAHLTRMLIDRPVPQVAFEDYDAHSFDEASPLKQWSETLIELLAHWIAG